MIEEKMRRPFAKIEMEPINLDLRSEKSAIDTVMGKHNRIEIGTPSCLEENEPLEGGLLTGEDLKLYNGETHSFYRLILSLTLLPDQGCRFQTADFLIDFSNTEGKLPLILRLRPSESTYRKSVTEERNKEFKVTLPPLLKITDAGLSSSSIRREEIEKIMVGMEIFGVRTKVSGWRFKLTDSREIPLTTTDLEALIVMPRESKAIAQFRIQASIDILSTVDKWLTLAFKGKVESNADLSYNIP